MGCGTWRVSIFLRKESVFVTVFARRPGTGISRCQCVPHASDLAFSSPQSGEVDRRDSGETEGPPQAECHAPPRYRSAPSTRRFAPAHFPRLWGRKERRTRSSPLMGEVAGRVSGQTEWVMGSRRRNAAPRSPAPVGNKRPGRTPHPKPIAGRSPYPVLQVKGHARHAALQALDLKNRIRPAGWLGV